MVTMILEHETRAKLRNFAQLWGVDPKDAYCRIVKECWEIVRQALCQGVPFHGIMPWLETIVAQSADKIGEAPAYHLTAEIWFEDEAVSTRRVYLQDDDEIRLRVMAELFNRDLSVTLPYLISTYHLLIDRLKQREIATTQGEWVMTQAVNATLKRWSS